MAGVKPPPQSSPRVPGAEEEGGTRGQTDLPRITRGGGGSWRSRGCTEGGARVKFCAVVAEIFKSFLREHAMAGLINRRDFLRFSALAAGAVTVGCAKERGPTIITGQVTKHPASQTVNVAFIGVGGRGGGDLADTVKAGCNVVALCDVDNGALTHVAKQFPKARTYNDYRVLFDQMHKEIDAVVVATPDHHHYPASMMAMKLGKHVYCEKPLTHSVWEARQIARVAREQRLATQMGTQGHAAEPIRLLTEWIAAGVIGNVSEVHIWTDRPAGWWPQGIDRPAKAEAEPASLQNWDLWIGPAPYRPYHSVYLPFKWRGWWDFGTGALGDIGCHAMDLPWTALQLTGPTSVEAAVSGQTSETGPLWSDIAYEFPANGTRSALKLFWYDGRNKDTSKQSPAWKSMTRLHEIGELGDREVPVNGQLYIGDKGKIIITEGGPRLTPESKMKDFHAPPKTLPRSIGHHAEWLEACKGGKPAGSNFEYAGPLAEAVLMGNLAVRLGKKIEWDSRNMRATNAPEAEGLIRRAYRRGWEIY